MKYRSKPTIVEATQFNGAPHAHVIWTEDRFITIGKQGPVSVNSGDWIIAEPDGSGHYPCADAIFRAKYEPAE